jgi:hypothetical protein
MFFVYSLLACNSAPVLQAIPNENSSIPSEISPSTTGNILGDVVSAESKRTQKETGVYVKPPGVFIDVLYLGNRSFEEAQGIIAEQMGNIQNTIEQPMGLGIRYEYEHGAIQVVDGKMYLFEIALPESMRRSQALQLLGFPEYVDKYLITHREYILENKWEFRRIRMIRDGKDNEFVHKILAWKFQPSQ